MKDTELSPLRIPLQGRASPASESAQETVSSVQLYFGGISTTEDQFAPEHSLLGGPHPVTDCGVGIKVQPFSAPRLGGALSCPEHPTGDGWLGLCWICFVA